MLAHVCVRARAPPLAAPEPEPVPGPGPGLGLGLGLGSGSGSLPGLVLFESGFRVWAEQIRSTPLPNPLQPANGCPRERIRTVRQPLSENRPCGWAVERLRRFCPNRRNC